MALVPTKSPTYETQTPRTSVVDKNFVPEQVLDFSFRKMTDLSELSNEDPRSTVSKNSDEKYDCRCCRVNNNMLQDINNLASAFSSILANPKAISWLDLSFNELTKIDAILCDLPCLEIVYLHGNFISDITEVDKLGGLPALWKLTLHGNKIAGEKDYRWYVLSKIPHLRSLDFSAVTKADRKTASVKTIPVRKRQKKTGE